MRILHTADWHLGKKTEGRSRLAEQREVLDEIVDIAERERVDVVLVAGDVFDAFVPPSEAEELFFDAVYRLAGDKRSVVIISGNHDDALRLAAPSPFAEKNGVYIIGSLDANFKSKAGCVRSGKGYLELCTASGERLFLGLLPYPTEARFKEEMNEDEDYNAKMARWMGEGLKNNTENLPAIFMSHIFTMEDAAFADGGLLGLGGARAVPASILPDCAYVALGHIHRRQKISDRKNAYYSGAILEYAFDDAGYEKSVNVFDIAENRAENMRKIPLTKGKKLVRLEAEGYEKALEILAANVGKYAELNLKLEEPLTDLQVKTLKNDYPDLLTINLEFIESNSLRAPSKKSLSDEQLFDGYYRSKYGKEPPADIVAMFTEIINETD